MSFFVTYVLPLLALNLVFASLAVALVVAEKALVDYGVCQIDINSGGKVFEVEGGQNLLSALVGGQVFIPSACGGRGSCGHCKITVPEGGGPVLPTETPYVTRKEVRAGVRLACQVKVRGDIQVSIPEDLLNVKLFNATVASTKDLTHDIKEIRFELDDPQEISQRPGQYVQIQAPSPDGPVFRAYSISSPAYEQNLVELNVRLVPGGIGSTYLHELNEDDKVIFTGPFGEFRLSEDPEVEIVCVAGGCGMAPVRNIAYSIYDTWPDRHCWLFFGCRTTKDVFYLEEYKELAAEHPNFHIAYALSDPVGPEEKWDGETGFIHLSVDKFLKTGIKRQAFLCGPPPMIEAVMSVLEDKGMRPDDIFYDKF
ncbi:MAG: FAD-binding oxidoreductase [Planctomycetota bacterium]|jgi:Na+-transporting NADH:ubiquinone oxidoreductase subunit F